MQPKLLSEPCKWLICGGMDKNHALLQATSPITSPTKAFLTTLYGKFDEIQRF